MEIVPEDFIHRGLNARGVAKYRNVGYVKGYILKKGARYGIWYN